MTLELTLERPWLTLALGAPHRVLSWAINRPGFAETDQIVWREVRNADLPRELDVDAWLDAELETRGLNSAVAFLTSRDIRAYQDITVSIDGVSARCLATVGLSNAERVGARVDRSAQTWGTVNIAVITPQGLTDSARIEAISIATQARTVAILDAGIQLPTGTASGTGTDCIAVAAPSGTLAYAGLHTALGEAIGRAVLKAVSAGVSDWKVAVAGEVAT